MGEESEYGICFELVDLINYAWEMTKCKTWSEEAENKL